MFTKLPTSTVLIKLLDTEPDPNQDPNPNQEQKFRIRLKRLGFSRLRIRKTDKNSDYIVEIMPTFLGIVAGTNFLQEKGKEGYLRRRKMIFEAKNCEMVKHMPVGQACGSGSVRVDPKKHIKSV